MAEETTIQNYSDIFSELRKELPYKWRVQSIRNGKAACVAYIDSRDVQDLLDSVVGPENWECDYKQIGNVLYAGIGIFLNGEWVWKWDAGAESNIEKEKGAASDAFKRAGVKWGVGRFLYRMDIKKIPTKSWKGKEWPYSPERDKMLFSSEDISKYIEWLKNK
tara:strand:- start:6777 stop:7265 length:489 start_codon:yes stop_codon:yes gene_type:complete